MDFTIPKSIEAVLPKNVQRLSLESFFQRRCLFFGLPQQLGSVNRIEIGDGSYIGAGSCITRNVPS